MTRLSASALIVFTAVVSGLIFYALQPASASEIPSTRFVCAARVDCGAPSIPSTQELPTLATPIVVSRDLATAREKCVSTHSAAYLRLAKVVDGVTPETALKASHGCKVVSEAFPAR